VVFVLLVQGEGVEIGQKIPINDHFFLIPPFEGRGGRKRLDIFDLLIRYLQTALFWKSHLEPIFFIQSHTSNFHIVYILPIHINVKFHPIFNFLLYLVLKVTNEVNFIDWLVRETFC
jgi:hypothetical protein